MEKKKTTPKKKEAKAKVELVQGPVVEEKVQEVVLTKSGKLSVMYVQNSKTVMNSVLGKSSIIMDISTGEIYRLSDKLMKTKNDSLSVTVVSSLDALISGKDSVIKKLS